MNIILNCLGGPLDGTYEFRNFSSSDKPPMSDLNRLSAWMLLNLTEGQVGKVMFGESPAAMGRTMRGDPPIAKVAGASTQMYVVSDRREDGDTVFVTAQHRPT
jgi:hypothetical protein